MIISIFCRINRARNKWKDLIEASQLLPDNEQLFICDFHFDSKDIKRHKTRTTLHKDAVPNLPNLRYEAKFLRYIVLIRTSFN